MTDLQITYTEALLTDKNDNKCIKDAVDLITEVSYFIPSKIHYCGPVVEVVNSTKHTNFYFTFNRINDFPEKIVSINSRVIKYRKNINNNKWLFSTNENPTLLPRIVRVKTFRFCC